tara:strand:- start:530 stop:778 length:249 start_codon:yes stop_codon:yes gene_type:complete
MGMVEYTAIKDFYAAKRQGGQWNEPALVVNLGMILRKKDRNDPFVKWMLLPNVNRVVWEMIRDNHQEADALRQCLELAQEKR